MSRHAGAAGSFLVGLTGISVAVLLQDHAPMAPALVGSLAIFFAMGQALSRTEHLRRPGEPPGDWAHSGSWVAVGGGLSGVGLLLATGLSP